MSSDRRIKIRSIPMANTVTMLGIDFGMSNTGYAIAQVDVENAKIEAVRDLGLVATQSNRKDRTILRTRDDVRRAKIIADTLQEIVDDHHVDIVAAEIVTATQYIRPTFGFGVLVGITAGLGLPLIQVRPRDVKIAATGKPRASKADVMEWAVAVCGHNSALWPTTHRTNARSVAIDGNNLPLFAEHQADALAVIQAATMSREFILAAMTVDPDGI